MCHPHPIVDGDAYGEPVLSGSVNGNICHHIIPVDFKNFSTSYAPFSVPGPCSSGTENNGNNIPADLGK
jgi:hypothetical protein